MFKTVETNTFLWFFDEHNIKKTVLEIEIFCNSRNVFDQLNASLLNKSINYLKKRLLYWSQIFQWH